MPDFKVGDCVAIDPKHPGYVGLIGEIVEPVPPPGIHSLYQIRWLEIPPRVPSTPTSVYRDFLVLVNRLGPW